MIREKLRDYFKTVGVMSGMLETIEMFNKHLASEASRFMDAKEYEQVTGKYMTLVRARMDELEEKYINIYSEFYTEEDIDALLVFHNTPVSKKTQAIHLTLAKRCMEASQEFNEQLLQQMSAVATA